MKERSKASIHVEPLRPAPRVRWDLHLLALLALILGLFHPPRPG
jgi:hypothetical protein